MIQPPQMLLETVVTPILLVCINPQSAEMTHAQTAGHSWHRSVWERQINLNTLTRCFVTKNQSKSLEALIYLNTNFKTLIYKEKIQKTKWRKPQKIKGINTSNSICLLSLSQTAKHKNTWRFFYKAFTQCRFLFNSHWEKEEDKNKMMETKLIC